MTYETYLYNDHRVRVTLRLTVSQSVSPGVEPLLGLMTRFFSPIYDHFGLCPLGAPSLTRVDLSFVEYNDHFTRKYIYSSPFEFVAKHGPGQSMWDMWWTKWLWDRYFSEFFGFPLSASFHCRSPTHINRGWRIYPLEAAALRRSLTPQNKNRVHILRGGAGLAQSV
jgi:hypothetical protein